jgi:ketosteroid isomerase-like protein
LREEINFKWSVFNTQVRIGEITLKDLHPNVKLTMVALDAFNKRDKDAIRRYVSEDYTYTLYGKGPFAGVYRGIEEFSRLVDEGAKLGFKIKPKFVLADDEYVFVLGELTGKRKGKTLDTENCYLYRVENGKLVEGRNIPTDQSAFDEYCK